MGYSAHSHRVAEKMKAAGLRPTRQRIMLGQLLWPESGVNRHVRAEDLHNEAKTNNLKVSLATIYNTLHQFTDAGLLKEVCIGEGYSLFDTNTAHHHHFLYEETKTLEDIPAEQLEVSRIPEAPPGKQIASVNVMIRLK